MKHARIWRNRGTRRSFSQPLWTGADDINDKILFAYVRAGLGDAIQFYRYVVLAQARGARIILSVNDPLLPLLHSATPSVSSIGLEQVPERFDYHIPLMSMPLALGVDIPATGRYLAADPARVAYWRERLGAKGFRIAIAWQGNTGKGAEGKSFPLAALTRIAALPGIRLISLQKNEGAEQLMGLPLGMNVENFEGFDEGSGAFLDSAAILENCDLLISCDTGLAHVAGALGVANWIALKYVPDWRWFLNRSDTPWYPNTRLFRQTGPGDWTASSAPWKQRSCRSWARLDALCRDVKSHFEPVGKIMFDPFNGSVAPFCGYDVSMRNLVIRVSGAQPNLKIAAT